MNGIKGLRLPLAVRQAISKKDIEGLKALWCQYNSQDTAYSRAVCTRIRGHVSIIEKSPEYIARLKKLLDRAEYILETIKIAEETIADIPRLEAEIRKDITETWELSKDYGVDPGNLGKQIKDALKAVPEESGLKIAIKQNTDRLLVELKTISQIINYLAGVYDKANSGAKGFDKLYNRAMALHNAVN